MIVAVPTDSPVTMPLALPMLATDGSALIQVPPEALSLNVAVPPRQTVEGPVMDDNGSIDMVVVAKQPPP